MGCHFGSVALKSGRWVNVDYFFLAVDAKVTSVHKLGSLDQGCYQHYHSSRGEDGHVAWHLPPKSVAPRIHSLFPENFAVLQVARSGDNACLTDGHSRKRHMTVLD